jgi:hypothetical protein
MLSQHWLACVLAAFRYIFRVGSESDLAPGNQPGNDPSREFGHTVDISAVGHLLPGNRFSQLHMHCCRVVQEMLDLDSDLGMFLVMLVRCSQGNYLQGSVRPMQPSEAELGGLRMARSKGRSFCAASATSQHVNKF